jgi:membrane protein
MEVFLISNRIRKLYQRADRMSGNRINLMRDAVRTFTITRANQAAAGLAYYAIFSLFPLLLVLISAGSFFLSSEQAYFKVSQLIQQSIPDSSPWISENLHHILEQRGTIGIIGLITLVWAASGGFISLAYNINLAWLEAPQRNFFQGRLVAFEMIASLSGLFFLSFILDWIFNLLRVFDMPFASFMQLNFWRWFSVVFSWLTIFLLFFALYYWVPTVNVEGHAAFWAALLSSVAWELSTALFSMYLHSGFGGRYQMLYGSIGALVAFLFLVYILATITLFGAHLAAAIDRKMKLNLTATNDQTATEDLKG